MTSLLKSEATFKERAKECGLTDDEIKALLDQGLSSLSALAFSATTSRRCRSFSSPVIPALLQFAQCLPCAS